MGELAAMLKMTAAEVIKKLFTLGQMVTVNEVLDYDTVAIVAEEPRRKGRERGRRHN